MKTKNKQSALYQWQKRAKHEDIACAMCGRIGFMTVDHIVPVAFAVLLGLKSREMYNDEWNLQYLCRACNYLKGMQMDYNNPKTIENIKRYTEIAISYFLNNKHPTEINEDVV